MVFPPRSSIDRELLPERGTLDAGCEKRRLTLIVCDGGRLALRAKLIEGNALSREKCQEILGCECFYPIRKFALPCADLPNAQLPRHVNGRSAAWSSQ